MNDGMRDLGVSSHFPVLAAAVLKTTGPTLELGAGWGSSPMLKLMSRFSGRKLESYDNNKEWADMFGAGYVENWGKWEPKEPSYGVCFIDCSPGEERIDLALKMKDRAKYIVMHDAECDGRHGGGGNYRYDDIYPFFKYVEHYRVVRPVTVVLSNDGPFGLNEWDMGKIHA